MSKMQRKMQMVKLRGTMARTQTPQLNDAGMVTLESEADLGLCKKQDQEAVMGAVDLPYSLDNLKVDIGVSSLYFLLY